MTKDKFAFANEDSMVEFHRAVQQHYLLRWANEQDNRARTRFYTGTLLRAMDQDPEIHAAVMREVAEYIAPAIKPEDKVTTTLASGVTIAPSPDLVKKWHAFLKYMDKIVEKRTALKQKMAEEHTRMWAEIHATYPGSEEFHLTWNNADDVIEVGPRVDQEEEGAFVGQIVIGSIPAHELERVSEEVKNAIERLKGVGL